MNLPVYLDYHATTPVDPRVVEAMLPYFTEHFGNAASRNHPFGWKAAAAVEHARGQVAALIGASPRDVIFTSGATESNNLAIKGVAELFRDRGDHLVTVATEHKSVLDACQRLAGQGSRVTVLPVDSGGLVDLEAVRGALGARTVLVSVMAANNEIGVLQPVREIAAMAAERGVLMHVDAAQAAGKIPFDVGDIQADLVSFTAHKLCGPKGVGALYVRRRSPRLDLPPQMDGGHHERGLRSGTLNVPGIVGFGKAAELCREELPAEARRITALRDRLRERLTRLGGVHVNGSVDARLPHNLNVSFEALEGESLLMGIGDIAISAGSACSSASIDPSHVLTAIGLPDDLARASVRFGLGRFTTDEEIDFTIDRFTQVVTRLREMAPTRLQAN